MDGIQILPLQIIERSIQQNMTQPDYTVQWRAQFVADRRNKGGFVLTGLFQLILIALMFGNITAKPDQPKPTASSRKEWHLTHFKTGTAAIRIRQPHFVGDRLIFLENFPIPADDQLCQLWIKYAVRCTADNFITFAPQQMFQCFVTA